jgi:uncharacterized protein involved in outer membrane biogenesis
LLVFILLAGIASFSVYHFKDRIIQTIVSELNKGLNTKVTVEEIDIAFWETFPKVSLQFNHIKMRGSFLGDDSHLLLAEKLYLSFNALDLYNAKYQIAEATIENADIHLVIREDGKNNFTVFNEKKDGSSSSVAFKMDKVMFKNVNMIFENQFNQQTYDLFCNQGEADFNSKGGSWGVNIAGDFFVHRISVEHHDYLASRQMQLNTSITYDNASDYYQIKPSDILIDQSLFNLEGKFGVQTGQDINLTIKGKKTNIQTIMALLPTDVNHKLSVYKSDGDVYFNGSIKGKIDSHYAPEASFEFGCSHASFWHPDFNKKVENLSFKGLYSNGKKSSGEASILKLENVQGSIDGKAFASDLEVRDFTHPYMKFNFNGTFDLTSLKQIINAELFESLEGELKADMFFEGYKKDLEHISTMNKVKSFGNLALTNCNFVMKNSKFKVQGLNTQFSFDNNAIHLHELTANAQGQDILLRGYLYHYLMYLAGTRKDLDGELQLEANRLDLEKLLIMPTKTKEGDKALVSDESKFVFQCDVKNIVYKKFFCKNVKGKVTWHNKALTAEGISMKAAGGNFTLNGTLDMTKKEEDVFSGKAKCSDVKVDSLFYLFDNFGQNFITDKHLKGNLVVDADLHIPLDKDYRIKTKTLKALMNVNITNGELNGFEPMQELSRFIDAKELNNLRFQELKNTIRIENETIYLPEMEMKSNVNTVSILGTQNFSGLMDFKVKVLLKNYKKTDPDAVFGAIKEDGVNTTLFLTMKGMPDNITIAFDKQAVKDKIKDSWKKEKEEFKSIFKTGDPVNKEKNKPVEVKDDEFIEID